MFLAMGNFLLILFFLCSAVSPPFIYRVWFKSIRLGSLRISAGLCSSYLCHFCFLFVPISHGCSCFVPRVKTIWSSIRAGVIKFSVRSIFVRKFESVLFGMVKMSILLLQFSTVKTVSQVYLFLCHFLPVRTRTPSQSLTFWSVFLRLRTFSVDIQFNGSSRFANCGCSFEQLSL